MRRIWMLIAVLCLSSSRGIGQSQEPAAFTVNLVFNGAIERTGWQITLKEAGLFDLKGEQISNSELRRIVRQTVVNSGKEEQVVIIGVPRQGVALASLERVVKQLAAERNPSIPAYVYVSLLE